MTTTQNPQAEKAKRQASKFLTGAFWALRLVRYLGVGICGVAELTQALLAQQSIPRFTSGVDVVQFTVTVLDKDRHPITGLTASDFDVLVDGMPKPLAAFAAVTLLGESAGGAAAASIPPVAPDVTTNQLPAEGRLVVIVMDRSTPDEHQQAAHNIANAAVDRLGPNDVAAVVYTGTAARTYSQGLTVDRARLRASANLLSVSGLHAAPGVPSLAAAVASHGAPQKTEQLDRGMALASEERGGDCDCGICVLDSLTALAKSLTGSMGRHKSILFVGSDIALASRVNGAPCETRIHYAREQLSRALDEANVTFNVVDPRGLENFDQEQLIKNIFRQQSLAVLPDETGGRVVLDNNKPEGQIGPMFDESRAYYVLAVARDPAVRAKENRHQIKITVKRPAAIVQARTWYSAAAPKAATPPATNVAAAALNELLPVGEFALRMNLVPYFLKDGSAEIRVMLAVDSAVAGKLDVLLRAFDRAFTPIGTPVKQRLDVPASAVAGSAAFQWASALKPPPGDYEIRAAVATADGQHAASVIGYTDVPDVKKEPLALSGIFVSRSGTPTLQRVFAPGEGIGLSFQMARGKEAASAVSVRYLVQDEAGQTIVSVEVPHDRAVAVSGGIEGYEIGVRAPALGGRYVLRVEASAGQRAATRQVPIEVR